MDYLEDVSDKRYIIPKQSYQAWFVDLFVRSKNSIAIQMYERLGYSVYQVVTKYYSKSEKEAAEDAYGTSLS